MVKDPSGFYANMHTTVNAGGAIRDQLRRPFRASQRSVGLPRFRPRLPLPRRERSLSCVYGTNLAPYTSDLSGFNQATALVTSMNGLTATIGGVKAPIYFVSPGQLNVQVPFEVAAGTQPVVVTSAGGTSTASNVTVASVAPSIFVVDQTNNLGAIVKNKAISR